MLLWLFKIYAIIKKLTIFKYISNFSTAHTISSVLTSNKQVEKLRRITYVYDIIKYIVIVFFIGIILYQFMNNKEGFTSDSGLVLSPTLKPSLITTPSTPSPPPSPSLTSPSTPSSTIPLQPSMSPSSLPLQTIQQPPTMITSGQMPTAQTTALNDMNNINNAISSLDNRISNIENNSSSLIENSINSKILPLNNRISKIEAYNIDQLSGQVQTILKQQQKLVTDLNGGSTTPLNISS